jgi:hypothetical protein
MGRRTQVRTDYVKDAMAVYRLREALRIDPTASDVHRIRAMKLATDLMDTLRQLDNERNGVNVSNNRKAKS